MTTEDTEWNDILREKGIIPEITHEQLEELVDQVIASHNEKNIEDKDLKELDDMQDDDLEDDRVLESYRRARMKDIQEQARNEIYGAVTQITKPDYNQQVTVASQTCWVVVLLFQSYLPASRLMLSHIETLARKYKATKFIKIQADLCIENYPDVNVPTLLIYGEGDLKQQIIGLSKFGGLNNTSLDNIEIVLKRIGALGPVSASFTSNTSSNAQDDEDEDDGERDVRFKTNYIGKNSKIKNDDDDDDWD